MSLFGPKQREQYPEKANQNWTSLVAGGGSGFATRCISQPFDVLKIRFQLQIEPISKKHLPSKYQGVTQAVKLIVQEEGFRALWKGHVPAQILSVLYSSVQFASFEFYRNIAQHYTTDKNGLTFVCGSLAGCTATFAAHPFDLIRTRLVGQSNPKIYRSVSHAFVSVVKHEGVRQLFRGFTPALIAIAPQTGAQFAFYQISNDIYLGLFSRQENLEKSHGDLFQKAVCGGTAGFCAKFVVYPLDLIKKRLQIQGFEEARKSFGVFKTYFNLKNCILSIIRDEGFPGFYKGLLPSLLKSTATTALQFIFYEELIKRLNYF